ncbi:ppm-1.H [Pristionchus pacificus]|uniref:PPM-type phosphatase domain-containing protein n=1 Tax=Pristionchus pacificus TaxID=54126 RepID=A0A2A6CBB8_PRIPA|nr:ppm-1.H [Pristionchus pacificus]|eukprot:PDM75368.1 hypothetical protein PRIPAC_42545 [Pristionchus pacificus]
MDLMALAQGVRNVLSSSSRSSAEDADDSANGRSPEGPPNRLGLVVDMSDANFLGGFIPVLLEKVRHPYCRPEFLYFTDDDIAISADKSIRPVICPKNAERMPLLVGYAETINAGKTLQNEDQATARLLQIVQQGYEAEVAKELDRRQQLKHVSNGRMSDDDPLGSPTISLGSDSPSLIAPRVEAAFFAIFDGHAGTGASIMASRCLHEHIKVVYFSRLSEVLESLIEMDREENFMSTKFRSDSAYSIGKGQSRLEKSTINADALVIGALESAYVDMDHQIAEEKQVFKINGGCAVISATILLGKIYVANAGDCRAVLVTSEKVEALSCDLTPAADSERKRLQEIAYRNPEIIGSAFSRLEYARHLTKKDLRKKVLYRDWFMQGWSVKTVRDSDLRPPLISDRFKKKRLLNTIGVSRGFGDHHLLTADDKLSIKPFLSAVPEVRVFDIRSLSTLTDKDVLILGSDGLWDVISNEDAALIVKSSLSSSDPTDASRYCAAAQELATAARGNPTESYKWMMNCGGLASTDDITVLVIPLKYCIAPPRGDDEEDDDEMINLD